MRTYHLPFLGKSITKYDPKDKERIQLMYIEEMLSRTNEMFEYTGLPETIPARNVELQIQTNGFAVVYKSSEGLLYTYGRAGLGGKLDRYEMPTKAVFAVAGVSESYDLIIDETCIVIPNDVTYQGLMPMYRHYSNLLTEAGISIRMALINTRAAFAISAQDDNTKESAELYLKRIENGDMGVIAELPFIEGLKAQPLYSSNGARIIDLIETAQYIKSNWYYEIGLQSVFNMKRESLNQAETNADNDTLIPLVDNMLKQRKIGWEKVNQLFGTNVTVDLSSAWKKQREIQTSRQDEDGDNNAENE